MKEHKALDAATSAMHAHTTELRGAVLVVINADDTLSARVLADNRGLYEKLSKVSCGLGGYDMRNLWQEFPLRSEV